MLVLIDLLDKLLGNIDWKYFICKKQVIGILTFQILFYCHYDHGGVTEKEIQFTFCQDSEGRKTKTHVPEQFFSFSNF